MSAPPLHTAAAQALVARLGLEGHPEGGFYKRWYTALSPVSADLPASYPPGATRPLATAIHYLLDAGRRSVLHRIKADELWLWQGGGAMVVVELLPRGLLPGTEAAQPAVTVRRTVLGPGHTLTHVVPGGAYFGAFVPASSSEGFSLVSCVVTPGFSFDDWEMHGADELPGALQHGLAGSSGTAADAAASVGPAVLEVAGYLAHDRAGPLPGMPVEQ